MLRRSGSHSFALRSSQSASVSWVSTPRVSATSTSSVESSHKLVGTHFVCYICQELTADVAITAYYYYKLSDDTHKCLTCSYYLQYFVM